MLVAALVCLVIGSAASALEAAQADIRRRLDLQLDRDAAFASDPFQNTLDWIASGMVPEEDENVAALQSRWGFLVQISTCNAEYATLSAQVACLRARGKRTVALSPVVLANCPTARADARHEEYMQTLLKQIFLPVRSDEEARTFITSNVLTRSENYQAAFHHSWRFAAKELPKSVDERNTELHLCKKKIGALQRQLSDF